MFFFRVKAWWTVDGWLKELDITFILYFLWSDNCMRLFAPSLWVANLELLCCEEIARSSYNGMNMPSCVSFHIVWHLRRILTLVKERALYVSLPHCCHKRRLWLKDSLTRLSLSALTMTHTPTRPAEILSRALNTRWEREMGRKRKEGCHFHVALADRTPVLLFMCPDLPVLHI